MDESDRVVVTGLGAVSPAGCSLDELWCTVRQGSSTARTIESFDPSELAVRFACEVKADVDSSRYLSSKEARRLDRFVKFALLSALMARADAGNPPVCPTRAAVVAGAGTAGALTHGTQLRNFITKGRVGVHPLTIPTVMANAAPAEIAIRLGWRGPNFCVTTACASGGHAIGEGLRLLRDGSADMVLAGGTEASITPFGMAAFANLQALSSRNEEPSRASRPFDLDRDGFVMAEGAAFCLLERLSDARHRGARIYGELAGYGRNCDAHHTVMPDPAGASAADCMRLALAQAGARPADVVQVNAHGTSTQLNDRAEAAALHDVFGDAIPPVTAPKGVLGHLVAAAGAIEFVLSCLSLLHGEIPPTANFEVGDDGCSVPVSSEVRTMEPGPIVSNSFGFGGHNTSLVVAPV